MANLLKALSITAAVVAMTPLAHAESVLTSSPLARGGVAFSCRLANVGTTAMDVRIELVGPGGTFESTTDVTIGAGASSGLGRLANSGSAVLYCRFTILKGSKSKVRANACAYSSMDPSGPCLATSEAR